MYEYNYTCTFEIKVLQMRTKLAVNINNELITGADLGF